MHKHEVKVKNSNNKYSYYLDTNLNYIIKPKLNGIYGGLVGGMTGSFAGPLGTIVGMVLGSSLGQMVNKHETDD